MFVSQLVRREVKTETSEAPLPLPGAVRDRAEGSQASGRTPIVPALATAWIDTGLVFTTRSRHPDRAA